MATAVSDTTTIDLKEALDFTSVHADEISDTAMGQYTLVTRNPATGQYREGGTAGDLFAGVADQNYNSAETRDPGRLKLRLLRKVLAQCMVTTVEAKALAARSYRIIGSGASGALAQIDLGKAVHVTDGYTVSVIQTGQNYAPAGRVTKIKTVGGVGVGYAEVTFDVDFKEDEDSYRNVAASTSHANTTDAADFDETFAIPANTLKPGSIIKGRISVWVEDNNSTDTLTLILRLTPAGGSAVAIVTISAVDVADDDCGYIDFSIMIRTAGASGTMVAHGMTALGAFETAAMTPFLMKSTAIDTTKVQTVSVNADWSVAHADNECELALLEVTVV